MFPPVIKWSPSALRPEDVLSAPKESFYRTKGYSFHSSVLRDPSDIIDWETFIEKLGCIYSHPDSRPILFELEGNPHSSRFQQLFYFDRWVSLLRVQHLNADSIIYLSLKGLNIGLFTHEQHIQFTQAILELSNVLELELSDNQMGFMQARDWALWNQVFLEFKCLRGVYLRNNQLGKSIHYEWMLGLKKSVHLAVLDLAYNDFSYSSDIMALRAIFDKLFKLDFSGNRLHQFSTIPSDFFGINLVELRLNDVELYRCSFKQWQQLLQSFYMLSLQSLSLRNNQLNKVSRRYWDELIEALTGMRVSTLDLKHNGLVRYSSCFSLFHGPTRLYRRFPEKNIQGVDEDRRSGHKIYAEG